MTRGGRPIVVPLDGSKLAEAALPVALDLAGLPRAEVTFLQVILAPDKVIGDGEPITIDQQWESEKCRAREYPRQHPLAPRVAGLRRRGRGGDG